MNIRKLSTALIAIPVMTAFFLQVTPVKIGSNNLSFANVKAMVGTDQEENDNGATVECDLSTQNLCRFTAPNGTVVDGVGVLRVNN